MISKFFKFLKRVVPARSEPLPSQGSVQWLTEYGVCPDCFNEKWNPGPEGGMSQNIRCVECGSKWCFTGQFTQQRDRIDNSDSAVYDLGSVFTFTPRPKLRKVR